jgi:hypothetical protein
MNKKIAFAVAAIALSVVVAVASRPVIDFIYNGDDLAPYTRYSDAIDVAFAGNSGRVPFTLRQPQEDSEAEFIGDEIIIYTPEFRMWRIHGGD